MFERFFRPAAAAAVLLIALCGGCGGGESSSRQPPSYLQFQDSEQILSARVAKDKNFQLDPDSPIPPDLRERFAGLEYFEFDPELRFFVHLDRYPEPKPFTIVSTEGEPRPAVIMGSISFDYGGASNSLMVYSLRDLPAEHWDSLFLPFQDQTTGSETYGAGRYIELANGSDDWYVLDFNTAYNPLCAYGRTIYRCPSTPVENRLKVAIRAGEKGTGLHPEGSTGSAPGDSPDGKQDEEAGLE